MAYDMFETLGREEGLQARVMQALEDPRLHDILRLHGSSPEAMRELLGGDPERLATARFDRRSLFDEMTPAPGEAAPAPEPDRLMAEAIVRLTRRPVYLVKDGKVDMASGLSPFEKDISAEANRVAAALAAVGRIEFVNHQMEWGGTGWLIEEDLVVTNRHVASLVGEPDGRGGYRFRAAAPGIAYGAQIDFLEEYGSKLDQSVEVRAIEYIAPEGGPDIALLRLSKGVGAAFTLAGDAPKTQTLVGVVGYPAYDSRNDGAAITSYFGAIFDKKRFAPGYVMQEAGLLRPHFTHDCSTLGGNSGSVVIDLATQKAVGLHFAGTFKSANFAVPAHLVARAAKGLKAVAIGFTAPLEAADSVHDRASLSGRGGYQPDHLGHAVPLPGFAAQAGDIADVTEADGSVSKVARFTHFSVVYNARRRMPQFTAVNIDGAAAVRIKRGDDRWFSDLRLDPAVQLNSGHFSHPDIDRGHMVRREDPNWGADAVRANADTFHYINAAPQHARLNQGQAAWLGLEEYILGNARTRGFRVSVFTGPMLRDDDRTFDTRSGPLQIPEEFWKVVVAGDANGAAVRATAYVLGQGRLLDTLEGVEFAYGQYGTFQVSVASVQDATGLDFGDLVRLDPLAAIETPGVRSRVLLRRPEEAQL